MEAIVPHETKALKPTTPRAIVMAEALKEDTEQRALLAQYVDEHMVEGTDYGAIPGTPQEVEISIGGKKKKVRKNNLLKPGAEKLFDLFRCRPEYEIMSRDVDRETGLYAFEIRCRAVSRETDTILNEGLGSASSFESKYRYRKAERICPGCGKANIRKSKPPREGWYCWDKTGGCGTNFAADDSAIVDQETGKVANPDLADVANTVLKIAKKRAQVDCAIALARVSDLFTQDLDELPEGEHATVVPPARKPEPDSTQRAAEAIVKQVEAVTAQAMPELVKPLFDRILKQADPKGPGGTHTPDQVAYAMRLMGEAATAINLPAMEKWTKPMVAILTRHFFPPSQEKRP